MGRIDRKLHEESTNVRTSCANQNQESRVNTNEKAPGYGSNQGLGITDYSVWEDKIMGDKKEKINSRHYVTLCNSILHAPLLFHSKSAHNKTRRFAIKGKYEYSIEEYSLLNRADFIVLCKLMRSAQINNICEVFFNSRRTLVEFFLDLPHTNYYYQQVANTLAKLKRIKLDYPNKYIPKRFQKPKIYDGDYILEPGDNPLDPLTHKRLHFDGIVEDYCFESGQKFFVSFNEKWMYTNSSKDKKGYFTKVYLNDIESFEQCEEYIINLFLLLSTFKDGINWNMGTVIKSIGMSTTRNQGYYQKFFSKSIETINRKTSFNYKISFHRGKVSIGSGKEEVKVKKFPKIRI